MKKKTKKKLNNTKNRGFASLKKKDPTRFFQIVAKGGTTAHARKRAFRWTPEQARLASAKGLETRRRKMQYAESN